MKAITVLMLCLLMVGCASSGFSGKRPALTEWEKDRRRECRALNQEGAHYPIEENVSYKSRMWWVTLTNGYGCFCTQRVPSSMVGVDWEKQASTCIPITK